VVSLNWGPGSGAGLVSPELAREYVKRGFALIDAEAGVESLLAELSFGAKEQANVVLSATRPAQLLG
jgi:hypothetical protein